ncbi:hypothetical protein X797_002697 [Metarhizium robertsii]|uniref:Uncharacterized protein n=2 Tax=Metarhizium robertsii TaxID=568076 RepID=E9EYE8_METRA|nr:uncharacterized protein MAA_05047 [Metarhizium robertsii ARSEF 23]EFY98989.2 hypothetical protein MAA_05047 [Metarhizium robertsii ARSEF 23]EXV05010.1 hypothetical protein X797_002697 [Metarhizium robertsii]
MAKDTTETSEEESSFIETIDPPLSPFPCPPPVKTYPNVPGLEHGIHDTTFNIPPEGRRLAKHAMAFADYESARNTDLYMLHAVEFELCQGDTLIFVDLPNIPKDTRKLADCDNIVFKSQKFLVHSKKLLATGSTKFAAMLGPSYQFRVQRRRKLVNKLPDGVKYLLDLTPPSEGDELVFQMTEVSLTPGIMNWWTSYRFHGAEIGLVAGHDDICCCKRQASSYLGFDSDEDDKYDSTGTRKPKSLGAGVLLPPTPLTLMRMKAQDKDKLYETPEFRQIPDYCPIRHRNGIIRLLILLEGREISMDSAARMWTMVAVAKILDCTSVVRDKVAQWMLHDRNARFIEVLPEEALKIGYDLRLQEVTQTAFRILVNEMALEEAATDHGYLPRRARTTIFGRRIGECSDELNNLIQHASRTLVERVTRTNLELQSPDLFDRWAIGEWGKLRSLEALLSTQQPGENPGSSDFSNALDHLNRLMTQLRFVIGRKYSLSAESFGTSSPFLMGMDIDRATYVHPMDFDELGQILVRFNPPQKLLCPFIYNEMSDRCHANFFTDPHPDKRDVQEPSIPALLDNFQASLEWLVSKHPDLIDRPEWQVIVNEEIDKNASPVFRIRLPIVALLEMEQQVKQAMQPLTRSWIRHEIEPPANITRHLLLTLDHEEMKFLPLWAGGLNDGTGGVFESRIPSTDMGANGPGPAYHTGHTIPSAPPSISDTLVDDIFAMEVTSTPISGTIDFHDDMSIVYRDDEALAEDVSIKTESFQTAESDYDGARFALPASHQELAEAVDSLVEAVDDFEADMQETPVASDYESDSDGSVVMVKRTGGE